MTDQETKGKYNATLDSGLESAERISLLPLARGLGQESHRDAPRIACCCQILATLTHMQLWPPCL